MKKAFIFPGQGAQYVGMGKDFCDTFAISRDTFEEADDLLQFRLSRLIFEGPEKELTLTKHSQLAIFVTSVAMLRATLQQIPDLKPSVAAGLSLGEYTALFATGRLGFRETLALVQKRATFMNEACERQAGTMAVILGLSGEEIERALKGIEGIWVANYNCPGQIVISGTREGVEKATEILKSQGAKRVLPLEVHGAFHSGLMTFAERSLAPFIEAISLEESAIAFVMNATGDFVQDSQSIKKGLIAQVSHSVRWEQGVRAMRASGVELFLEIGCGKTLTGMNRKIDPTATALSIEKIADLETVAKKWEASVPCSC